MVVVDRWAVIHHHFDERSFNVWEMNKIFLFASVAVFLSFHRLNETSRNIYFAGEKKIENWIPAKKSRWLIDPSTSRYLTSIGVPADDSLIIDQHSRPIGVRVRLSMRDRWQMEIILEKKKSNASTINFHPKKKRRKADLFRSLMPSDSPFGQSAKMTSERGLNEWTALTTF